jgi:hypothetical protein
MKRILPTLFGVLMLTLVFSGCGPVKKLPVGPSRDLFTGTWTLNAVTFSGLAEGSVPTVFDQAPPADFVNSTWQLNATGDGSYTLTNGTKQNISWSVNSGDALGAMLVFKKVNSGDSSKKTSPVYQLTIANNSGTSMTLKTLVYLGNKNGYIIYTFTKAKA